MEYVHDDLFHDSLRAHFQTVDVVRLNNVLIEAGITDVELRQRILDSYFFDAGAFLDDGWFEAEGRRFATKIGFEELDSNNELTERIFLPDPDFGTIFHEFSHGTVALLFEPDSGDALKVTVGEVGIADE